MIGAIIFAIGLGLLAVVLLGMILPNFKREKRLSEIATRMMMSELERERAKQGYIAKQLARFPQSSKLLDMILGEGLRRKFVALGKKESYEVYMLNHLILAILLGCLPLIMYVVVPQNIVLAAAPLLMGLFFYSSIISINNQYNARQKLLIRDLPNVISKMISGLEVGRAVARILQDVSESKQTSPLLSRLLKRMITDSRERSIQDAMDRFANEVDLPVVYDFTSVVNVILIRSFHEAEKDLNSIKDDLRELRYLSLTEQTRKEPGKMIRGYLLLAIPCLFLIGSMLAHIFGSFAAI